jgi:hypothetical protein
MQLHFGPSAIDIATNALGITGTARGRDYCSACLGDRLGRLKAIDRHPIEFTNADNLVPKIVNGVRLSKSWSDSSEAVYERV